MRDAKEWKIDLATSIGAKFKVLPRTIGTTEFTCDAQSAWRTGFREGAKLASKLIKNQVDAETDKRLDIWCTVNLGVPNGDYAVEGAISGRNWARAHPSLIDRINDYDWLYQQWLNHVTTE